MLIMMLRENSVVPFTTKQTNLLFQRVMLKWSQILLFAQILILHGKFLPHHDFRSLLPCFSMVKFNFCYRLSNEITHLVACWASFFSTWGTHLSSLSGFFFKDVDGPVHPVVFALFGAQVSHFLIILSYFSKDK